MPTKTQNTKPLSFDQVLLASRDAVQAEKKIRSIGASAFSTYFTGLVAAGELKIPTDVLAVPYRPRRETDGTVRINAKTGKATFGFVKEYRDQVNLVMDNFAGYLTSTGQAKIEANPEEAKGLLSRMEKAAGRIGQRDGRDVSLAEYGWQVADVARKAKEESEAQSGAEAPTKINGREVEAERELAAAAA